jgi:poly(hydroxyalkanoate) granule-associated protein
MKSGGGAMEKVRTIKRYRNRRLYDTHTKEQITLARIRGLVKAGVLFKVEENDTGRDLTLLVLTQALGEELRSRPSWGDTGEILRALIQQGGDTGMTILSKTVMAAIGALAITRENAEKLIDELIKRGELDKSKRAEAVKEAVERAETRGKETYEKVKDSVTTARAKETAHKVFDGVSAKAKELKEQVIKMRPASSDEVESLRKTITELEAKLDELKNKME